MYDVLSSSRGRPGGFYADEPGRRPATPSSLTMVRDPVDAVTFYADLVLSGERADSSHNGQQLRKQLLDLDSMVRAQSILSHSGWARSAIWEPEVDTPRLSGDRPEEEA